MFDARPAPGWCPIPAPESRGCRLHERGDPAGAADAAHPQGCPDPERAGGHRAGRVRADTRQPAHQSLRDPRRPGALRGDKQPAVPGRPDRSQLSRRTTSLVSSLHFVLIVKFLTNKTKTLQVFNRSVYLSPKTIGKKIRKKY